MPCDFTEGTWECNYMPEEFRIKGKGCIIMADGKYVASVQDDGDGRLISAAPKMYALLCALHREGLIPKKLGTLDYPALEKMRSIVEIVTGDRINFTEA